MLGWCEKAISCHDTHNRKPGKLLADVGRSVSFVVCLTQLAQHGPRLRLSVPKSSWWFKSPKLLELTHHWSSAGEVSCVLMPPGSWSVGGVDTCDADLRSVPSWTPSPRVPLPPTALSCLGPTLRVTQHQPSTSVYTHKHSSRSPTHIVAVGSDISKYKHMFAGLWAHKIQTHTYGDQLQFAELHNPPNKHIKCSYTHTMTYKVLSLSESTHINMQMVTLNLVMHLVSQFTQSQVTADSDTHSSQYFL